MKKNIDRSGRPVMLAVLVTALWAAAGAASPDRETALDALNRAQVDDRALQLDALFNAPGGLDEAAVMAVLNDPSLATVEREWLIHRFLIAARDATPDGALRTLVRSYLSYKPLVMVAHEEGGHDVPLFDVSTAAQGTINKWTFVAARDGAVGAFQRGEFGALSAFAMETDRFTRPVKAGLLAALAISDTAVLDGARDWILAREGGADFGDPLGVIATRTADAALYEYVLERSSGPVTIRMINAVDSVLARDAAIAVLSACLQREDISSAALFRLGQLSAQSSTARDIVIDRLSDPALGATAAAVIAKSGDPQMLNEAATRLGDGGLTGRRALLALKLNDSPSARSYARAYLDSGDDARLKTEVATWLSQ